MKTHIVISPTKSLLTACGLMVAASTCADSTNCITPPAGLVGWWTGDGDATDFATYNHGTTNGGVGYVPGKVNLAFRFDGVTGYVLVPNSPNLDLRPEATYAAWINLSQFPAQAGHVMYIVGKPQSGNDLDLQVEGDNRVRFYAGAGVSVATTSVLQTDVWYFVAATYRTTNRLEVFVNGVLEATNAFPYVRTANPNPLTIGATVYWGGRFFSGSIDEVQVYDRALSSNEIQAIYDAGSAGLCRPHLLRIYTAVEIGWPTETNRQYQVQWISPLATNDWTNFGAPIQGTGSNVFTFDSTRDREKCFYRVLTLPP